MRGYDPGKIIPGEMHTEKYECVIPIEENTAKLWRAAIAKKYKDVVTEHKVGNEKKERRHSVLERRKSIATNVRKHSKELVINEKDMEILNRMSEAINNESIHKKHQFRENNELKTLKVKISKLF